MIVIFVAIKLKNIYFLWIWKVIYVHILLFVIYSNNNNIIFQ